MKKSSLFKSRVVMFGKNDKALGCSIVDLNKAKVAKANSYGEIIISFGHNDYISIEFESRTDRDAALPKVYDVMS